MQPRSNVQIAALTTGAVFLLVAALGFVPAVVTDFGELQFAGHRSDATLLGLFQVSVLHNVVHALFGVAGVAAATSSANARRFLLAGGVAYLALTAFGILVPQDSALNFVPVNTADDLLHAVLGVGMLAAGLAFSPRPAAVHATQR